MYQVLEKTKNKLRHMWVKGIENVVEERRWKARRISFVDTKHKMCWCNSSKRDDGIRNEKENTLHKLSLSFRTEAPSNDTTSTSVDES